MSGKPVITERFGKIEIKPLHGAFLQSSEDSQANWWMEYECRSVMNDEVIEFIAERSGQFEAREMKLVESKLKRMQRAGRAYDLPLPGIPYSVFSNGRSKIISLQVDDDGCGEFWILDIDRERILNVGYFKEGI